MSEPPRPPSNYDPYGGQSGEWGQQPDPTRQWQGQQGPPSGQWQGQPSGQWQSPAPKKKRSKLAPLLIGAMVLAAVATGGGLYLTGAFSTEIRTEAVAYEDPEAFTATVGDGVELASLNTPAPPAVPAGAPDQPVLSGNRPGLYGGTGDDKSCNKEQLVAFLESDPAKAAAWAQVQGIQVSEIRSFVASLTPMLLRADTAVTNHGFRNGQANPINSVLQAGTAVLVDDRGEPRARCKCGNPLIEGKQFTRTKYSGTVWPGFEQKKVTKVQKSPQQIQSFDVINVLTGQSYQQKVDNSVNVGGTVTPGTNSPNASKSATATRSPGSSARTTTTTRAPAQQQQQQQQAPAQQQQQQQSSGETCQYTDAGDGSPITAREGSSFTDSRGESYRVGSGCNLIPT